MGANESREAGSRPDGEWTPLVINANTFEELFPYPCHDHQDAASSGGGGRSRMGQPGPSSHPSQGGEAASPSAQQPQPPQQMQMLSLLMRQHERLILELFTFKDGAQFQAWLRSPQVRGSWLEFRRDSPGALPLPPKSAGEEMDKAKAAQQARDAVRNKSPRYLLHYPDKRDWTIDDHIVRFIAVVIEDNLITGMWSSGDWSYRALDISRSVYEVLVFLRSTDPAPVAEASPPGYSA